MVRSAKSLKNIMDDRAKWLFSTGVLMFMENLNHDLVKRRPFRFFIVVSKYESVNHSEQGF